MSILVTDYSKYDEKYGGINNYIAKYHPKRERFVEYRKRWQNNKNDLLFLLTETNSKCNLKCPMCIHPQGYDKTEDMTDEIFDLIIKNIKEMEIPSVCMNQENEPLLDKKIFERIRKVANCDCVMDIFMNTNATLLNKENSLKILESGLTRLLIGFDAFSKEIYEKIRLGAKYEKIMKNILDFLELKREMNKIFPVVRISLVRLSINEHEIEKWFEFWKDKVDYITIQEYITTALDNSKDHLLPKSSKRKEIDYAAISCRQPFERVIIRGNGDVLPCCSAFVTKTPIGNIKQNSLKTIWHGEKVTILRKYFEENKWIQHPICSKCLKITYGLK